MRILSSIRQKLLRLLQVDKDYTPRREIKLKAAQISFTPTEEYRQHMADFLQQATAAQTASNNTPASVRPTPPPTIQTPRRDIHGGILREVPELDFELLKFIRIHLAAGEEVVIDTVGGVDIREETSLARQMAYQNARLLNWYYGMSRTELLELTGHWLTDEDVRIAPQIK
jgi:hypothetical protein